MMMIPTATSRIAHAELGLRLSPLAGPTILPTRQLPAAVPQAMLRPTHNSLMEEPTTGRIFLRTTQAIHLLRHLDLPQQGPSPMLRRDPPLQDHRQALLRRAATIRQTM